MHTFKDLCSGDMFNTKAARWVKISDREAICVLSLQIDIGDIWEIEQDEPIVLLYSSILA